MARGRKPKENSFNKLISVRITEKHKEIVDKNAWIKKEVDKLVRDFIDEFTMN